MMMIPLTQMHEMRIRKHRDVRMDNFVNVDPDAEGVRKVEEQQRAERRAELRKAASVASITSKFQELKIIGRGLVNRSRSCLYS
jgi:hypothetical protein